MDFIRDKISAFSAKQFQELLTLLKVLEYHKINLKEFEKFVKKELEDIRVAAMELDEKVDRLRADWKSELNSKLPRCPECGSITRPYAVNTGPRDRVGGKWRSQIICVNEQGCGWSEYHEETVSELAEKFGIGVKNG